MTHAGRARSRAPPRWRRGQVRSVVTLYTVCLGAGKCSALGLAEAENEADGDDGGADGGDGGDGCGGCVRPGLSGGALKGGSRGGSGGGSGGAPGGLRGAPRPKSIKNVWNSIGFGGLRPGEQPPFIILIRGCARPPRPVLGPPGTLPAPPRLPELRPGLPPASRILGAPLSSRILPAPPLRGRSVRRSVVGRRLGSSSAVGGRRSSSPVGRSVGPCPLCGRSVAGRSVGRSSVVRPRSSGVGRSVARRSSVVKVVGRRLIRRRASVGWSSVVGHRSSVVGRPVGRS